MSHERSISNTAEKLLVIHIDDLGMSHTASRSGIETIRGGIATSGSVMMPCPWVEEVVEAYRATPDMDLGVHVTFTSEWQTYKWGPVSPKDKVPSLLDRHGYFPRKNQFVKDNARADEFEVEMRAQVEMALGMGLRPTHIDSHMEAAHLRRDLLDVFIKIGKEYGLVHRLYRPGDPACLWMLESPPLPLEEEDCRRLEDEGVVFIDHLLNYTVSRMTPKGTPPTREMYREAIRQCVPGVNYLFLHTMDEDNEALGIFGERRRGIRHNEYLLAMEKETREAAADAGARLVTWREVGERRDAR